MKLTILQEKLKNGLQYVDKILTKPSTFFASGNIFLKAEKNLLKINGTNLETGIKCWILSKVEKDGQTVIPLHPLLSFVSFLPNKPIVIEKKENVLSVECDNFKTQIKCLSTEEFPIIPEISPPESFLEISPEIFCHAIEEVASFVSSSQTKPEISGIFIIINKNFIKFAATDSFRLGEKTIFKKNDNFSFNKQEDFSLIMPHETAKQIINIFSGIQEKIKIYLFSNQIVLESYMQEIKKPEVQFISRLIEGDYPPYQEVVPKKYDIQAVVFKNDFLNHLKAASVFGGKTNEIKLIIDEKKQYIKFLSQNPEIGEHQSALPARIKGGLLEISFNYRFLINGITNIKEHDIVLGFNKEDGPAVLKPFNDNSYFYVVMPIKT